MGLAQRKYVDLVKKEVRFVPSEKQIFVIQ